MAIAVGWNSAKFAHYRARAEQNPAHFRGFKKVAATKARRQPSHWLDVVGYGGLPYSAGSVGVELRGHHAEKQYRVCCYFFSCACVVLSKQQFIGTACQVCQYVQ